MSEPEQTDHTARDIETFFIIGGFTIAIGLPVALGVLWEPQFHARVVTLVAAAALFIIGGGMVWRGFQLRKRLK